MAEEEIKHHYHAALILFSLRVKKSSESLKPPRADILVHHPGSGTASGTEAIERSEPVAPEQNFLATTPVVAAKSKPRRIRFTRSNNSSRNDDENLNEAEIEEIVRNYNPPALPPFEALRRLIGKCTRPFEKQLTNSDVNDAQSRLTIGKDYVEHMVQPLLEAGEDLTTGIPVTVYDGEGKGFPMTFKVWEKLHVLTSGWKQFCKEHGLRCRQDFLTIWVFRNVKDNGLCFAISWRRLPVFHQFRKRKKTTDRWI